MGKARILTQMNHNTLTPIFSKNLMFQSYMYCVTIVFCCYSMDVLYTKYLSPLPLLHFLCTCAQASCIIPHIYVDIFNITENKIKKNNRKEKKKLFANMLVQCENINRNQQ